MELDTDPMHIRMFFHPPPPPPPNPLTTQECCFFFIFNLMNIIEYPPIKLVSSDKVAVYSF